MQEHTWERIGTLFEEAIAMPPGDRGAWLDRECAGDERLRAELGAMLSAHSGGDDSPESVLPSTSRAERLGSGDRVGPWRLDAVIGRGGMGEVFRASRVDDQFHQLAAIKIVRPERAGPELIRRFLRERQILAQLSHPNIATLLDGGVAPGGQPWLAMQFVDGVPITTFAEDRGLSIEERLRLLSTVCDAVQYAHQHLVVHRDLKPSNILVGSDGQPRLLDFGIAKLLDPAAGSTTTGDLRLLTPEHAAPEQFLGRPVTTATDVYALGVLAYELLTGTRPFRDLPAPDLPRAVCEDEPLPPSRHRPLDADLDQIVLMALRKEPARRYASAGAMGADLVRFLGRWPVIARPDTTGYRLRRFVRRNRGPVAAAAVAGMVLMGAAAFSAWQSAQRAEALRLAQAESERANRITNFLLGIFRATNPNETRGRTVTARELLDQAAARAKTDLANEPAARADMENAIGRAYALLGLNRTADSMQAGAVAAYRAMRPVDTLALATAIEYHARTRLTLGNLREGIGMMKEVVALREARLGPNAIELAPAIQRIGVAAQQLDPEDKDSTSVRHLDRALALYLAEEAPDQRAVAELYRFKAVLAEYRNRLDEALSLMREAVAATEAVTSPDDPFRFNIYETYANYLAGTGQRDSAIAVHRRNLERRRRVFGPDHPDVTFSLFNLSRELSATGRHEEAIALSRECLTIREKLFGPVHLQVAFAAVGLARATAAAGDTLASLPLFERAASVAEQSVGPGGFYALAYRESVARIQLALGRQAAAVQTLATLAGRGYKGLKQDDWKPLHSDRRFQTLLNRAGADSVR